MKHISIQAEENMTNIGDQVIENTSYGEERILNMLGKSLPPYAAACFKNAVYDNAPDNANAKQIIHLPEKIY